MERIRELNGTHELLPCGLTLEETREALLRNRNLGFTALIHGVRPATSRIKRRNQSGKGRESDRMKLAQVLEYGDWFPTKPTVLAEFSQRFLSWLDETRMEEKTRKYYRNGCRLLNVTPTFSMRLTEITSEDAEKLKFPGSAGNANCASRTLRRMLHKLRNGN